MKEKKKWKVKQSEPKKYRKKTSKKRREDDLTKKNKKVQIEYTKSNKGKWKKTKKRREDGIKNKNSGIHTHPIRGTHNSLGVGGWGGGQVCGDECFNITLKVRSLATTLTPLVRYSSIIIAGYRQQ